MLNNNPMKILIIEDDPIDCENFRNTINKRNDFEIVAITDSDIDALKYIKTKHPEGIVLDIELNNSISGNTDSLDLLNNLKNTNLGYQPIIIVTTHINSKHTYDLLHRSGVDIIIYKGQPSYSCDFVLNKFIALRNPNLQNSLNTISEEFEEKEDKISEYINKELDLIGVTSNLKGRQYIHDAILYLIIHDDDNISITQYLTKIHKKSSSTITNGIQNAIIHAWKVSSIDDLTKYYTAKINYETGLPTPMEFIYYYVDKIKKLI